MRKIDKIIIHCSATPRGREVTVGEIARWHRQRGFRAVGYHYVIYLDGSVHVGRPIDQEGAHCTGHNATSVGICYIGGIDSDGVTPADTRTDAQRQALRVLVEELRSRYPGVSVHGHNEFSRKACPCFDVATSGL